ncbi:uncharacterized protein ACLA_037540 [Aspergillus clavatus NRRL 1]|uniref:Uncharacterized protein n=1 Tax=Aspergillus clavatus (strain ATCC 1007 / CBS 513.65 / DSM 816 / NCTC 3887 / NRRL 1 / QM 1276 / 107) TaxID=344612 RepID=A1CK73_ASPCL|nr:uncharacterized protein ACLA_037540 [Aspergillus clavatus NRRL 1]EAW09547.1 hypothetical protein ACLA_037540 [Aspergillus clavatus NRRL 1]
MKRKSKKAKEKKEAQKGPKEMSEEDISKEMERLRQALQKEEEEVVRKRAKIEELEGLSWRLARETNNVKKR